MFNRDKIGMSGCTVCDRLVDAVERYVTVVPEAELLKEMLTLCREAGHMRDEWKLELPRCVMMHFIPKSWVKKLMAMVQAHGRGPGRMFSI